MGIAHREKTLITLEMLMPVNPAPFSSNARPGDSFSMANLPGFLLAFANVQARAYADWLTLYQEAAARYAGTRNPLEYMTVGSLMLPSCVSYTMQYCKNVSEIAGAGRTT